MLAPPDFLFIQINKRCNLRCQHCDFWQLDDDDRPRYLSNERRSEVLGEFASMRPGGKVVICGGESMLDLDDYFDRQRRRFKAVHSTMGVLRCDDTKIDASETATTSCSSPALVKR